MLVCYDSQGKEYEHCASFYVRQSCFPSSVHRLCVDKQRAVDCCSFKDILSQITGRYHNHQPKHVFAPDESFFKIVDATAFNSMSSSEIQIHLQRRVMVVPDFHRRPYPFSRFAICELNSLNTDVSIEGGYTTLLLPDKKTFLTRQ